MAALSPQAIDILAKTVAGEALGEGPEGWLGVSNVLYNRTRDPRWPSDPAAVARQPKQFSAWNEGEGGNSIPSTFGPDSPQYKPIVDTISQVFGGQAEDITGGATHYYAPAGMQGGAAPSWAEGKPYKQIGGHRFLSADGPPQGGTMAQPTGTEALDFMPPEARRRVSMALGMGPQPIRPMGQSGPQMVNFTGPGEMQVAALLQQAAAADDRAQSGINNGTIPGGLASVLERVSGAVNRGRAMSADEERRKAIVEALGGGTGGGDGPPDPRLAALDPALYERELTEYNDRQTQAAQQEFTAGENQLNRDNRIAAASAGRPQTNVTVTGDAAPNLADETEAEAQKNAAKKFGEVMTTMWEEGGDSQQSLALVDELDSLLSSPNVQTGTWSNFRSIAQEWGIQAQGSEEQAAKAIISRLIPQQRVPGSGTSTDADMAVFAQAIPSMIGTKEGNALILQTMRDLAQYNADRANIASDWMAGDLGRRDAINKFKELDKSMSERMKARREINAQFYGKRSDNPDLPQDYDPEADRKALQELGF